MLDRTEQAKAFSEFETLVSKYNDIASQIDSSNEAKTRLLIIDEVLLLLGWSKDNFNPEKWIPNSGFADYLLKCNETPRLVVEAKKIGITFKSPSTKNSKVVYEVRYLRRAFKNLFSEIIDQALAYCKEEKVPYAVITNGAEWVALQLIPPPGVSLDSAKAIYFGNIFSDNFEFDLFWSLLSRKSFDDLQLEEYLAKENYQHAEVSKVLQADYSSLQWKVGQPEKYLSEFYENFFSKITDSNQRKMLEYCFVSDSKLDQYRGELKRLLKDTKPSFLPMDAVDLEPGESKESILNDRSTGQVVIITGSVGCGKSTLVTKCLVEARQQSGEFAKTILIDLINEVGRANLDVTEIIYRRIYEFLELEFPDVFDLGFLRRTFAKDIKKLRNSSHKEYFESTPAEFIRHEAELLRLKQDDIEGFIYSSLKQLTSENNSVIVILDNVDRADEKLQEEMYAFAHRISSKTGAKTIITLREFTFFRNKSGGFLDVRPEDRVIHLKSPNFEKLISKRVRYIENCLDDDYRKKDWRKQAQNFNDFLQSMSRHASALKQSILVSSDGHNILETLSSISWHNIRYFYDLLRRVHRQLGSGEKHWDNQEVIAALMSSTEVGESPVLPNIFIPHPTSTQSYFLKIRLLAYLSILQAGEAIRGVPLNRISEFLRLYGYLRKWIYRCIEDGVRQKLVECLEIPVEDEATKSFEINKNGTYRLSPLGLLYLNQIIRNKTYCSLIAVDLPIHSLNKFKAFKKEFDEINSYMTDKKEHLIFKEGLEIILSSSLSHLTTQYLRDELSIERVLSESFLNESELQLTERKISEVFYHEESSTKNKLELKRETGQGPQLMMDFDENTSTSNPKPKVDHSDFVRSLGYDFDNVKYDGTEFIPLIFCALRLKSKEGIDFCNGADITDTINDLLVGDGNKKYPNNVSRALRTEKLKSQGWLEIRSDLHPKRKYFGLSQSWKSYWVKIFEEDR
ncbi:hypothetical protein [Bowmanella denitrificans]|uniref:hypothetical protein n=1 Tax=Bowmanella denitrificans TaxID=366582 RepID=UPI0011AFA881|nr:hypothetical protein [Bowmanella denitrificans]